jgi:hypothetical protein
MVYRLCSIYGEIADNVISQNPFESNEVWYERQNHSPEEQIRQSPHIEESYVSWSRYK